jgi:hypothetical protein
LGPRVGTLIYDLDLGHPHLRPRFGTPIWDPDLGPQFGTPIWDPGLGASIGHSEHILLLVQKKISANATAVRK